MLIDKMISIFKIAIVLSFAMISVFSVFHYAYCQDKNDKILVNVDSNFKYRVIIPEPFATKGNSNWIYAGNDRDSTLRIYYYVSSDGFNWDSCGTWINIDRCLIPNPGCNNELIDGEKHYYKVRLYRNDPRVDTSATTWSFQDATAPIVTIDSLNKFQNTNSFYIPFVANDAVCDSLLLNVQSSKLLYRTSNDSQWSGFLDSVYTDAEKEYQAEYTTQDSFLYKCPENFGDGYYEFYIKAKDWAAAPEDTVIGNGAGNEEDGYDLNSDAWMSLYVDTHSPFSKIDSVRLSSAQADSYHVYFSAYDSTSPERNYRSGLKKIILLMSEGDSNGIYKVIAVDSLLDSTYEIIDSITFPAPTETGYYYLKTEIVDSAKNVTRSEPYELVIMEIDSPEGDEIVSDSLHLSIEWHPKNKANVTLFLYANDTLVSTIITDSLLEGSFEWQPRLNMSYTNCKIMLHAVISTTGQQTVSYSENYFKIDYDPPSFALEQPVGGEHVPEGVEYVIKWKSLFDNCFSKEDLVKNIYLSVPDSEDILIADSEQDTFETDTSYIWTVPENINSDFCKIRLKISDPVKNTGIDSSNWFSIKPFPHISEFEVTDTDTVLISPSDSLNYAMPGWTNQQDSIFCRIKSEGSEPDFVKYWILYCGKIDIIEWSSIDTSVVEILTLPDFANTTYQINCQLKNNTGLSNVDSSFINLDLSKPIIDSIKCSTLTKTNKIQVNIFASDTLQKVQDEIIGKPHRIKLSEDPELSLGNPTTKLYWYYQETVDFTLSNGEGEKVIYCQVADSAGNWSETVDCMINVDLTEPYVTGFNPLNGDFVHGKIEDFQVNIQFSEDVVPQSSWTESITLTNVYENREIESQSITPFNSSVIFHYDNITDPSLYRICVTNYKDLLGWNGKLDSSEFYIFMEEESGGQADRSIGYNSIRIDVDENSLPQDAVFQLSQLENVIMSPQTIGGVEEFSAQPNTFWRVRAVDENDFPVDTLVSLNISVQLMICFAPQSGITIEDIPKLRVMQFDHNKNLWQLLPSSISQGNCVSYSGLNKISGCYGIFKQTESDVLSNYPNPFNPKNTEHNYTTIRFSLKNGEHINKIKIYDLFGNLVKVLTIDNPKEGVNEVTWDGCNGNDEIVANGGYICVIKEGMVRKIAVLK